MISTIDAMEETQLVSGDVVVTCKGESAAVDISAAASRTFLLLLKITDIVEQESLDVSIAGSEDGSSWILAAVANFPQKFYRGEHPLLVDLTGRPEVRFLRAQWNVNRWGRGDMSPMFKFDLTLARGLHPRF